MTPDKTWVGIRPNLKPVAPFRKETMEEYLARGGTITKQELDKSGFEPLNRVGLTNREHTGSYTPGG